MTQRFVCDFLATGFYSGRLKPAPGTWGTAVGAALYALLFNALGMPDPWVFGLIAAAVVSVLGVYVAQLAGKLKLYGPDNKDPQPIVIDEIAGYFVTMCGFGATPMLLLSGFLLFRFYDVLKPSPIHEIQDLPGGWGIVFDDLLAGVYANLTIRAVMLCL